MTHGDALVFESAMLINADEVAPETFNFGPAPAQVKPLRKLPDGTLRSGLLNLPEGWTSSTHLRARATLQLMLRRGRITLGNRTLATDAFVVVPAGGVLPPITVLQNSELLIITDAGQSFEPAPSSGADALITEDVYAIEPIVPVIAGRPLVGFERRVLWLDPTSGADTRLLRIPAGFSGPGPNWHPVNEEIFCLEGEIEPAEGRSMQAGWFLWNPARSVHGYHESTRPGCTLLEWHDGPWDLVKYRQT